jgi:hypothetical protein
MNATLKSWIAILSLAATSVVTIATSKVDSARDQESERLMALNTKYYYVASSCPAALNQDQIHVVGEVISDPPNRKFIDFGLPIEQLNFAENPQINGLVRGSPVTCYHSVMSISTGTGVLNVYSCYENNRLTCQVSFEEFLLNQ